VADEGVSFSDKTSVGMPIRNLIGLIGSVCLGAWGYFGILERLNVVETSGRDKPDSYDGRCNKELDLHS